MFTAVVLYSQMLLDLAVWTQALQNMLDENVSVDPDALICHYHPMHSYGAQVMCALANQYKCAKSSDAKAELRALVSTILQASATQSQMFTRDTAPVPEKDYIHDLSLFKEGLKQHAFKQALLDLIQTHIGVCPKLIDLQKHVISNNPSSLDMTAWFYESKNNEDMKAFMAAMLELFKTGLH